MSQIVCVIVCVCVCETDRVCVCERESEGECVGVQVTKIDLSNNAIERWSMNMLDGLPALPPSLRESECVCVCV